MESSITFTGELDERSIDREVDQLNRRLQDAGNIDVTAEGGDLGGMGDLGGGVGGGGGMGGGDGTSLGDLSEGIGGLGDSLKSRMPKSIGAAGGVASAAAPVALAGAVGMGMASAMASASASMQTSATILQNSWQRVWRPIGDRVDELFIRDAVNSLGEDTRNFESFMREGREGAAIESLVTGNNPDETELGQRIAGIGGSILGGAGGALAGAKAGAAGGAAIGSIVPGAGTAAGGTAGAIIGAIGGALGGAGFGGRLASAIADKIPEFSWPDLPEFGGWPDVTGAWPGWPEVDSEWGGWPSVRSEWGGWPSVNTEWGGWPSVRSEWGGWPSIQAEWTGWPDIGLPRNFWPDPSLPRDFWPSLDPRDVIDELTSGRSRGGGGNDDGGGFRDNVPFLAGGGRVAQTGAAVVHRDEMVADPDRLVSELASAVSSQSGGGGGTVDMSGLERKLDTLIREVRQSGGDGEASIRIGEREFAKLVGDAQSNTTTSTDRLS